MATHWVISAAGDETPARAWAEARGATYVALAAFVARHPYLEPDERLFIWIGAATGEDQAFVVAVSGLSAALADAIVVVAPPGDASVLGDLPPGWRVAVSDDAPPLADAQPAPRAQEQAPPEPRDAPAQATAPAPIAAPGEAVDERSALEDTDEPPRQVQQEASPPDELAREEAPAEQAPPQPAPAAPAPAPARRGPMGVGDLGGGAPQASEAAKPVAMARKRAAPGLGMIRKSAAPADATAFAPKRLRRATPELVRIAVHQPKDLQKVIDAAKKADKRADAAAATGLGEVALGASVGVALDVHGAACDGALKRQTWTGAPLEFPFVIEAEADRAAKQAAIVARIFIDDAEIGFISFSRPIASAPSSKPAGQGERARLKRHKRVFLSYSSEDRETVAAIAVAYESAGVPHFFDRTTLKPGEEWHPRLLREIDRSDLFHLCWSKAAARSAWVAKEAEHALTRKRRSMSHLPNITVQMLDGPPWAAHPDSLDALNFDDFTRAAIVGYARGDGA